MSGSIPGMLPLAPGPGPACNFVTSANEQRKQKKTRPLHSFCSGADGAAFLPALINAAQILCFYCANKNTRKLLNQVAVLAQRPCGADSASSDGALASGSDALYAMENKNKARPTTNFVDAAFFLEKTIFKYNKNKKKKKNLRTTKTEIICKEEQVL